MVCCLACRDEFWVNNPSEIITKAFSKHICINFDHFGIVSSNYCRPTQEFFFYLGTNLASSYLNCRPDAPSNTTRSYVPFLLAIFIDEDANSLDVFVRSTVWMPSGASFILDGHITFFKTRKLLLHLCEPVSNRSTVSAIHCRFLKVLF